MGTGACRETLQLLVGGADQAASAREQAALRSHLARCELCASVAERLRPIQEVVTAPDTILDQAPAARVEVTTTAAVDTWVDEWRWDEPDDEDFDPDDLPAPFSLLQKLREGGAAVSAAPGQAPVLEVIVSRDEIVQEMHALGRGGRLRVAVAAATAGRPRLRRRRAQLARLRRDGQIAVALIPGLSGSVERGGERRSLEQLAAQQGGRGWIALQVGEQARLRLGPIEYLLRHACPPPLRRAVTARGRPSMELQGARRRSAVSIGASVGAHAVVLMTLFIMGFAAPPPLGVAFDANPEWRPVELPDLPPPQAEPEPAPVDPALPNPTPPQRRAQRTRPTAAKQAGVLDVIGKISRRPGAAGSQTLRVAVANVEVVKVPGGGAGYKLSGLTGRGPTDRVQHGGSGGGESPRSLASFLRKGDQLGELGGLERGAVRSRVTVSDRARKLPPPVTMDRAAIARVVNRGLGKIQFCYERELLKHPSLAGKVVFEWEIVKTGRVGVVRIINSSLNSARAQSCMVDHIKRWRFPKPRGVGRVKVTYPFLFAVSGF